MVNIITVVISVVYYSSRVNMSADHFDEFNMDTVQISESLHVHCRTSLEIPFLWIVRTHPNQMRSTIRLLESEWEQLLQLRATVGQLLVQNQYGESVTSTLSEDAGRIELSTPYEHDRIRLSVHRPSSEWVDIFDFTTSEIQILYERATLISVLLRSLHPQNSQSG